MNRMTRRDLFGAGVVSLAATVLPDVVAAKPQKDEVGDHILREAKRIARSIRTTPRQHETIAAFATNLRLHAAYMRSTGQAAVVSNAINRHVKRHGRSALLDAAHGPDAMQRHHDQMHADGFDDLMVPEQEISRGQSEQVLSSLMIPKTLPAAFEQAADALDHIAERVVMAGQPHIVHVQDIGGWCQTMNAICQFMKEAVALVCALSAAGFPELGPICAVMGTEAATACLLAWFCSWS